VAHRSSGPLVEAGQLDQVILEDRRAPEFVRDAPAPKRRAKPFISLVDVALRMHDRLLFDGLFWEMLDDQHWAVIGPNGSGKSALMRALCGVLPILRGKIVYHFEQDEAKTTPQDQIAYVTFESQRKTLGDTAFYQARWNVGVHETAPSVSDLLSERGVKGLNPYFIAESHSNPSYPARWQHVVEQLELKGLLQKNLVELSNGERRKVSIARAWLKQPRLLILDNPFAGLDERYRVRLRENLDNVMQGDIRVLIASTSRDEIPTSITHILRFNDNREITQGPRQAVQVGAESGAMLGVNSLAHISMAANQKKSGSTSPHKTLVNMENVNVSYNGTRVLQQVSWTVRENEQWALLGPNGAGKTTLLSLILADNPQAYANDITLFGRRRGTGESVWEIKQKIGWVAPELHLYYPKGATCLDVVNSGWFDSLGLYRQCSRDQRQVSIEWMERFGLAHSAGAVFEQLSEGEQRLVLVARACVKSPALLVFDEPCQGLDAQNRDRVLHSIDQICRRPGTSMIYVTHRADELPRSVTHVLLLNEGRVVDPPPGRN
jgi:molybdate transport system ATP-binding protein